MKFQKIITWVLTFALIFSGCSIPGGTEGTLSITADDVSSIQITNGSSNTSFTVSDRDTIRSIVKHINSLVLENGTNAAAESVYTLDLSDSSQTILAITLANEGTVTMDGQSFSVDAEDLMICVEKAECRTLTDEQLLRRLFEDNYWDSVTILNEDGEISLDKIVSLPQQVPALFELVGRTSILESIGTYGAELFQEYANSSNAVLRERAEKIGEILSSLIPNLQEQIGNILGK